MKTVVATAGAGAASQARIEQSFCPEPLVPLQLVFLSWLLGDGR
jgi:hypothetical protein